MIQIRAMEIDDYDGVLVLWQASEGIGLSSADSRLAIGRYLERNPGCSWLAFDDELLVGAVLCGHDGRRGYIHHLAVRPSHQRQGLGRLLVAQCLDRLTQDGIEKCHLFVFTGNLPAITFWRHLGFTLRQELSMMSLMISAGN